MDNSNTSTKKKGRRKRWFKATIYGIALIGLSIGFVYLLQYLMAYFDISAEKLAPTVYLLVFGISLVGNATIIVPVYFHVAIMVAAATQLDPVLIAFIASVGGTLGEMAGYYAGRLGKRIVINENTPGYNRVAGWMNRYGPLAIFFLSLQPVLPFDIAGLICGASRMPLWKFLLPCWAGKFPKYILLCYFGLGLFQFLPSWFP